jgi:hypothetical protein
LKYAVLALQAALAPSAAADLESCLTAGSEKARQASAVVSGALDRPDTRTRGAAARKAQRRLVTAALRADRMLRQDDTSSGGDDREHVLVSVRVDADDVIQLVCKHPD